MTIAAGFCVEDGILLASDTMYVGGSRVYQGKLFTYLNGNTPDECSLVFALAGHENFGRMAIEDCVQLLLDCPGEQRSLRKITTIFRDAVKAINDQYVDTRPDYERHDAKFELIIAGWFPSWRWTEDVQNSGTVSATGDR
jgi:hypothetical protein